MDALDFVNILMQNKNNMIDTIFKAREEELANLDKPDKSIMDKEKLEQRHKKLMKEIETIPAEYDKNKKDIFNSLEKYCNSVDSVNAYFNRKYYRDRIERWNQVNNRIVYIKNKI